MKFTLYTNDYLEYYLTLVGWVINNGIWDLIEDSGLFALPFAVIVIREWLKVRGEGADEGNKGVLSLARIETQIYVGFFIVIFCGLPAVFVSFNTIEFDKARSLQCQYHVPSPSETGWSTSFSSVNGKSAKIPIWWAFVHALSKAVTSGSVAAIPCGTDLRQMRMEVNGTRINNPLLTRELADFSRDCYGYSRARLFQRQPDLGPDANSPETLKDLSWIGSRFLLDTPGYYDTDYSKTPRTAWPYDETRDATLARTAGGGGYPTCKQWWSDSGIGLKDRVLAVVEPDLMTRFLGWAQWLSADQVQESIIRELVSPNRQIKGAVYTDYGGQVGGQQTDFTNGAARAAGNLGLVVGSAAYFPAMDVVRQALPMVMAFLKMAMVISIPLVLVVSTYDLAVTMAVSVIFFALIFVDFWFQLARWIDSTVLDALYGSGSPHSNFNPFLGLDNLAQDGILNFVMGAMFIILPGFWIAALGWAGIKAGNVLEGLARGTQGAEQAGAKGADAAKKAATKGQG